MESECDKYCILQRKTTYTGRVQRAKFYLYTRSFGVLKQHNMFGDGTGGK
jgi:hypothetical protein